MRRLLALGAACWLLACSPAPQAVPNSCLPYGSRAVTLSGQAVTRMQPGEDGTDHNILLLQLDAPVCVGAAADTRRVREIQLVPQSSFKAAYSLAGLHVTATGPLSPATAQQHTDVVMTLQAIGPR